MPRRFTLSEARALLPSVGRLLQESLDLKILHDQAENEIRSVSQQIALAGGMVVNRAHVLEAKSQRDAAAGRLRQALEEIQAEGVLVKDLDTGLIDFPTLFRGREVYLCWRLGERDIEHWHGVDEGFRGRKPIDGDFLQNHAGDQAH